MFGIPQAVTFIIKSVDEQLCNEFGLKDGIADNITWGELAERNSDIKIPNNISPNELFVKILDPAVGTGTFLVEVIDFIFKKMVNKWQEAGHTNTKIQ